MKTIVNIIFLSASFLVSAQNQTDTRMNQYEKEWAETKELCKQKRYKALIQKVDTIFLSAFTEKNYEQVLKAMIAQIDIIRLMDLKEEGAKMTSDILNETAEMLPQPAKSIVYSMIGEKNKDDNYFKLSLQDVKTLQNEPIDCFHAILSKDKDISYQPTLYDFLANRALNHYTNKFKYNSIATFVDNPDYFANAQHFTSLTIRTNDTLSAEYQSLKIFQDLLRFHLKNSGFDASASQKKSDMAALIDIDMRRLAFIHTIANIPDKDKLYEAALINMSKAYQPYKQNVEVLVRLADFYCNQGALWMKEKNEANKSGFLKAYKISDRIEKEYPNQVTKYLNLLRNRITYADLSMQTEQIQLPEQPFLVNLIFRNVGVVYKNVYPLSEAEAINYNETFRRNYNDVKQFVEFVKSLKVKPIQDHFTLPTVTDYQRYSTEIKMSPMKNGFYLIVLSDSKDWLQSQVYTASMVQISSLMAQYHCVDNIMHMIVTDRKTGKPVSRAEISLFKSLQPFNISVNHSFVCDPNGLAITKLNENDHFKYYRVQHGAEKLLVFNELSTNRTSQRKNNFNSMIFTDRNVYNPGQTVNFKGILYKYLKDKEKELVKNKTIPVRFRNINQQVIAEQSLKSNEFGSINGSFTIPQNELYGLHIELGDFGNTFIQVENFWKPTFKVSFLPVDGNLALNKQVKATAIAKTLEGQPISHAKVQYKVTRQLNFRYRYLFCPPRDYSCEISSGILETDRNGNATIEFTTMTNYASDNKIIYDYTVTAEITDMKGEKQSASVNMTLANKPLVVNTNLPDQLYIGKMEPFTVETTDLKGEFMPATVHVEVALLKSPEKILRRRYWAGEVDLQSIPEAEFRKDFPQDAYNNEVTPDKFKILQTVATYTIETANNNKLDLSALKQSGYYKLILTATNKQGDITDFTRYFLFLGDKPEALTNMDQWVTELKTSGKPGEQAEFLIAGGENDSHVFCEVIYNSQIVESKWIKTGKIPVKVVFPITETYLGGFNVLFSMVQNNRFYSDVKYIDVPLTDKLLDIQATGLNNPLVPGERATWTVQVKNKKEEGEAAEIIASLFDETSLYVRDRRSWNFIPGLYGVTSSVFNHYWTSSSMRLFYLTSIIKKNQNYGAYLNINHKNYANINWFDVSSGNNDGISRVFTQIGINFSLEKMENEILNVEYNIPAIPDRSFYPTSPNNLSMNDYDYHYYQFLTHGFIEEDFIHSSNRNQTPPIEPVFFYPALHTNENGEALIEFTVPETLTHWKLLCFAHTKDFKAGSYSYDVIRLNPTK